MLTLSLFAVAQNEKQVAVWETKCSDNSISPMQATMVRGGMETAVGNTAGYKVFDRSAFDVIMKEHGFQRSGAVKDADIKKLGEMAGVQYVIVPEAMLQGNDFYIIVKMLDVESGEFGGVYDALCSSSAADIYKACRELGVKLFGIPSGGGNVVTGSGSVPRGHDFTETAFGINMRMVYVEGGTFTMGCTDEQINCSNDEKPTRQTTVNSFYIGVIEVTQGQWEKVMGTTVDQQQEKYEKGENKESSFIVNGSEYPMYYVSWEEAKDFCMRLSRKTGKNYSLPTEAEWEYAARGGEQSKGFLYSGGSIVDDVAWYSGNSDNRPQICGTKRPNELGIYDMSGNVQEWCEDVYVRVYIQYDNNNPKGGLSGTHHVLRGGCWYYGSNPCRTSFRMADHYIRRRPYIGFRVVLH